MTKILNLSHLFGGLNIPLAKFFYGMGRPCPRSTEPWFPALVRPREDRMARKGKALGLFSRYLGSFNIFAKILYTI